MATMPSGWAVVAWAGPVVTPLVLLAALMAPAADAGPRPAADRRLPIPVSEVGEEKQRPRARSASQPRKPPPAAPDGEPHLKPADAVRWGLADTRNLPADVHAHRVRYISHYNLPPSRRVEAWKTVAWAVNSLSRSRTLAIPPVIPGTEFSLIRIDLDDYCIDPEQWDRLADLGSGRTPYPEPYFQQYVVETYGPKRQERQAPAGRWEVKEVQKEDPPGVKWIDQYGRPLMVRKRVWVGSGPRPPPAPGPAPTPGPGKKYLRPAVWLNSRSPSADIHALAAATKTQHPVVRGDWFVSYAMWAPRYYDLLGLGDKIEDFERLVRARDRDDSDRKVAGVVVTPPRKAKVALNNRFIFFLPTTNVNFGGAYWSTRDTKKSTDKRQYMNVLLDFVKLERGLAKSVPKSSQDFFDATEDIGNLANGLQAYFLTDGKGVRLDKADPDVAIDKTSSYLDAQVWAPRNCVTCHVEGIRPIKDAVRDFASDRIGLLVVNDDEHRTNENLVRDFFSFDMAPLVKGSGAVYDSAVRAVTKGRTSPENATAFMDLTAVYLDEGIDLKTASWEVGMPAAKLRAALSRGIGLDPTLTGLLKDPPEEIRRDNWENNSFPQVMLFLETYRTP